MGSRFHRKIKRFLNPKTSFHIKREAWKAQRGDRGHGGAREGETRAGVTGKEGARLSLGAKPPG